MAKIINLPTPTDQQTHPIDILDHLLRSLKDIDQDLEKHLQSVNR